MDSATNPAFVISPIFITLGSIFLLVVWLIYKRRKRIIEKGHNTTGKVVEVIRTKGSKGGYSYQPVIEYTPFMQPKIVKRHAVASSSANSYKAGDEVEIFYDPDKPERYIIKDDKAIRILFWVLGLLGAFFVIGGLLVWNFLRDRHLP